MEGRSGELWVKGMGGGGIWVYRDGGGELWVDGRGWGAGGEDPNPNVTFNRAPNKIQVGASSA